VFSKSIESDVSDDTSGDYKQLLCELLKAERDENFHVDLNKAKEDASSLFKAGVDKIGTFLFLFFDKDF